MLQTFNQAEWRDPIDMDHQIENMRASGRVTHDELRAMFPYMGIAKKRLLPYGIPEGAVLQYIRVKHEPSLYPFIGMIGLGGDTQWGNYPRRLILDSNEIQLVEV